MRVAIVGPGAMGCLFAYLLSRSGEDEILLIDNHPERERSIREEGLYVEGISGQHHLWPRISSAASSAGSVDLVLICVKSGDTKEAAEDARDIVGPATAVLTLQNGLGNVEKLQSVLGKECVLGGTTAMGATVLAVNRIRHAGWGETVIGAPDGTRTPKSEKVLELFRRAGIDVSFTHDLEGLLWSKLLINVGINALTALTRLHNGDLLHYQGTRTVMRQAVEEAWRVARAKGVRLLYPDPVEKVESVCRATAGNISSMLQDVLRAKRTEVEQINGAIVAEGQHLGIQTPVNAVLLNLVMTIQESYGMRVEGFGGN